METDGPGQAMGGKARETAGWRKTKMDALSFDGGNPDGGGDTDRYHRMMAADLLRDRQEAEQEINRLHERLVASQCVGTEASSPPSAASVLQNSHRAPTLAGGAEDGGGDGMPSVADGLAAAAGSASAGAPSAAIMPPVQAAALVIGGGSSAPMALGGATDGTIRAPSGAGSNSAGGSVGASDGGGGVPSEDEEGLAIGVASSRRTRHTIGGAGLEAIEEDCDAEGNGAATAVGPALADGTAAARMATIGSEEEGHQSASAGSAVPSPATDGSSSSSSQQQQRLRQLQAEAGGAAATAGTGWHPLTWLFSNNTGAKLDAGAASAIANLDGGGSSSHPAQPSSGSGTLAWALGGFAMAASPPDNVRQEQEREAAAAGTNRPTAKSPPLRVEKVCRAHKPKLSHRDNGEGSDRALHSERGGGGSGEGTDRSTSRRSHRLSHRSTDLTGGSARSAAMASSLSAYPVSGAVGGGGSGRGGTSAVAARIGGQGRVVKLRRDKHMNSLFTPRDEEIIKRTQREKKLADIHGANLPPGFGKGDLGPLGRIGEGADAMILMQAGNGAGLEVVLPAEAPRCFQKQAISNACDRLMAKGQYVSLIVASASAGTPPAEGGHVHGSPPTNRSQRDAWDQPVRVSSLALANELGLADDELPEDVLEHAKEEAKANAPASEEAPAPEAAAAGLGQGKRGARDRTKGRNRLDRPIGQPRITAEAMQAEARNFKRTHIDYASFMRGQTVPGQASNRVGQQSTPSSRAGMQPQKPQLGGLAKNAQGGAAAPEGAPDASAAKKGKDRRRSFAGDPPGAVPEMLAAVIEEAATGGADGRKARAT